ncbi:hypothetical protein AGMMS50212_08100 [Spirochaetia bacterium]|nr:hypothetical protein AGMMS50212_08100 [Spirochaetia bacterium]
MLLVFQGFFEDGKFVPDVPVEAIGKGRQKAELRIYDEDNDRTTLPLRFGKNKSVRHQPKISGPLPENYFKAASIDTRGFVFNREEANER